MAQELLDALTLYTLLSAVGAIIGTTIIFDSKKYRLRLAIFMTIGSLLSSVAVVEWVHGRFGVDEPLIACGLSVAVGMIIGAILDALRLFAPNFAEKLVKAGGDRVLDKVDKD